jgi:hypothetical protein
VAVLLFRVVGAGFADPFGSLYLKCLLLAVLVGTSLPDPVWTPGIHDGADYDDVVTDTMAILASALPDTEPARLVLGSVPSGLTPPRALASLLSSCVRSPPTA